MITVIITICSFLLGALAGAILTLLIMGGR